MTIDSKKILAGIVLYNPDVDVLEKNVKKIIDDVNGLILVDNASANISAVQSALKESKISFIRHEENKGLSYSYNEMMRYARMNGFDYLLLLDQDSECSDGFVSEYRLNLEEEFACLVPMIVHKNREYQERFGEKSENLTDVVYSSINSGTCINLIGLPEDFEFDESFFIDCIDCDFFLRLKKKNLKVLRVNSARLYISLGNITRPRFVPFFLYNYSPFRLNKQIQDRVKFVRKYKDESCTRWLRLFSIFNFFMIAVFEEQRIKKIRAMILGFLGKKV